MKKIGEYLLASNLRASVVAFVFTLLPLTRIPGGGFVAAIIVGLVTLRKGPRDGLIVLAWVALPAIALLYLHRFGVFDVLLLRCVLVWVFAALLREYFSWRLVLEVGLLIGFVGIVVMHLVTDANTFWTQFFGKYFREIGLVAAWKISEVEVQMLVQRVAAIGTGVAGFIVLFGVLLQLFLARWWQTSMFSPGTLRREFIDIRMGRILAVIGIVAFIGALLRIDILLDFLPLLLLPFLVGGLSLLHAWASRNKSVVIPLVLVYFGLFLLPIFMVGLLAFTGFIDSWYDFRKRYQLLKG